MSESPDSLGYRSRPTSEEDFDRELNEILSELRVLLPGVAVLFAFLLTVPFSSRFPELRDLDRAVYFVAFVASALALVCLVGESAYHRLRGKPYDKRLLIQTASHEAVAGILCLVIALVAVVFLVSDLLFPGAVAVTVTMAVLGLAITLWLVLPILRRMR
jgi:cobalamin synthase